MQRAAVLLHMVHSADQGSILLQLMALRVVCNAGKLLIYDAAGADVQVAYLRISHLAGGQSHGLTAGIQPGVGIFRKYGVQIRLVRLGNRVAVAVVVHAESVHDKKHGWSLVIHIIYLIILRNN